MGHSQCLSGNEPLLFPEEIDADGNCSLSAFVALPVFCCLPDISLISQLFFRENSLKSRYHTHQKAVLVKCSCSKPGELIPTAILSGSKALHGKDVHPGVIASGNKSWIGSKLRLKRPEHVWGIGPRRVSGISLLSKSGIVLCKRITKVACDSRRVPSPSCSPPHNKDADSRIAHML